ncbi:hypothetical protein [Nocardia amamiensis]|uniref:hypothetical protein n=1 Tax=Nocardia amamiensis TaxID=404578 RepID=UPI00082BDEE3|nr:hypothetical protein [Nocardia amamiensis]
MTRRQLPPLSPVTGATVLVPAAAATRREGQPMTPTTATVLPDWEHLLDLGIRAAEILGPGTDPLEATITQLDSGFRRPQVFDVAFMRQWLGIDARTACTTLRVGLRFARIPETQTEALQLLGPGCRDRGEEHFVKIANATREIGRTGLWEAATCCDCGHPLLRYVSLPSGEDVRWSFFPDLL